MVRIHPRFLKPVRVGFLFAVLTGLAGCGHTVRRSPPDPVPVSPPNPVNGFRRVPIRLHTAPVPSSFEWVRTAELGAQIRAGLFEERRIEPPDTEHWRYPTHKREYSFVVLHPDEAATTIDVVESLNRAPDGAGFDLIAFGTEQAGTNNVFTLTLHGDDALAAQGLLMLDERILVVTPVALRRASEGGGALPPGYDFREDNELVGRLVAADPTSLWLDRDIKMDSAIAGASVTLLLRHFQ